MIIILESLFIEMKKESKHMTDPRKSEILFFWKRMGSCMGQSIIMLSYVICFVSQILHNTIVKTITFVAGWGEKRY